MNLEAASYSSIGGIDGNRITDTLGLQYDSSAVCEESDT
jgi:hypothetical protein